LSLFGLALSGCRAQEDEIKSLIIQLRDEDKDVAAIEKLVAIGKPAAPVLAQVLILGAESNDKLDERLCLNVAKALKAIGGSEALKNVTVNRLTPIVKEVTILELDDSTAPKHTSSYFGGNPYAEEGDIWPICPTCEKALDFICQMNFKDCEHESRPKIGLFSFFYCYECHPFGLGSVWRYRRRDYRALGLHVPKILACHELYDDDWRLSSLGAARYDAPVSAVRYSDGVVNSDRLR